MKALRSTRGTGRPRSLTPAQGRQVFLWINGRNPLQYGLDFGLWTRQIVSILIKQKFGVRMDMRIDAQLAAVQRNPKLVRSFFGAPSIAYITDW